MNLTHSLKKLIIYAWLGVSVSGCATIPPPTTPATVAGIAGIYYRVEKGQTLWRISKIYDLDLEELVRLNQISDAGRIVSGQLIFVPHKKSSALPGNKKNLSFGNNEDFIWPLRGKIVAYFAQSYNNSINKGLNIQAASGSEVIASRGGIVSFYAKELGGLGKTIILDHGDGLLTVYARLSDVTVNIGENILQGKQIGKIGFTGRDKNIYLHFEIRKGFIAQNPYYYLP